MCEAAWSLCGKMRDVAGSDLNWISWEEASRLTGIRVPTIEHAVRVGRIARRPAKGVLPTLNKDSVMAWAEWQREQVAQRESRRRERETAMAASPHIAPPLRSDDLLLGR